MQTQPSTITARLAITATGRTASHGGHCQVCLNYQLLPGGLLSTHGYLRPGGYGNVDECAGSRLTPLQLDQSVFGAHQDRETARLAQIEARLQELDAGALAQVIEVRGPKQGPWIQDQNYRPTMLRVRTVTGVTDDDGVSASYHFRWGVLASIHLTHERARLTERHLLAMERGQLTQHLERRQTVMSEFLAGRLPLVDESARARTERTQAEQTAKAADKAARAEEKARKESAKARSMAVTTPAGDKVTVLLKPSATHIAVVTGGFSCGAAAASESAEESRKKVAPKQRQAAKHAAERKLSIEQSTGRTFGSYDEAYAAVHREGLQLRCTYPAATREQIAAELEHHTVTVYSLSECTLSPY